MPRRVILSGLGKLGLATTETLAASGADAITIDDFEETREDIINKTKAENKHIFYASAEEYNKMDKPAIAKLEDKFGCVIIPIGEDEIQQMKNNATHKLADIPVPDNIIIENRILTNRIDTISSLAPFMIGNTRRSKGGRYKESPRNAEKKKKSKRRQQKQSRRK